MVMADDENSDFVGNAAEQKLVKGTAANSLSGQGKIAAQQIRHGTADKPTAKRQVVCRTALIFGTAGSKFQPGRCTGSKGELKRCQQRFESPVNSPV